MKFLLLDVSIKNIIVYFNNYAKKLCFISIFGIALNGFAQKIMLVNQSPLTGVVLPQKSKLDKRYLVGESSKILLEDEAKKYNATLKNIEVLSLPPFKSNGFSVDSLFNEMEKTGWRFLTRSNENNFFWIQKNSKLILGYLINTKKETGLIFGESNLSHLQFTVDTKTEIPNTSEKIIPGKEQQILDNTSEKENAINSSSTLKFKFHTSNFDDGWTSVEKNDWVEVTKGEIRVLLHYPKEGTVFPADLEILISAAWNILVAPRYSNLQNFKTTYISDYNKPYLGYGYATEIETGKNVFVVLFRRSSGWIEVVAPDKNSFSQHFKFDPDLIAYNSQTELVEQLDNMSSYNKFAVDPGDFVGKWTNDFTGIQQLYNVYTGNYAGMRMNQSNEEFTFGKSNTYNWKLLVVNSLGGVANANQVKSSGIFKVPNNWQIQFSKIESNPKTYHAFWSCIKGARILNLLDAVSPGSGLYQQYGLSK